MIPLELAFYTDLIAVFAVYAIICLSLNMEFGLGGILNLGKVMVVAAGAFVAGSLPLRLYGMILGINNDPILDNIVVVSQINEHIGSHPEVAFFVFGVTIMIAIAAGAALGLVSSYPAIRLHGRFLAIVLLGLGVATQVIGFSYQGLVGGSLGISVPDPLAFLPNEWRYLVASLVLLGIAGIVYVAVSKFTSSPVGRLLRATRSDETAIRSLGRDVKKIKMKVMTLSGALGALGGTLYALYIENIVVSEYSLLNWTVLPFVIVVVGGLANNKGVVAATLIFVAARKLAVYYNESLGNLLSLNVVWLDYVLLGGTLIIVLMFRPRGIFPEKPERKRAADSQESRQDNPGAGF